VALGDARLVSAERAGFVARVGPDGGWGCPLQLLAGDPASLVWPTALAARPDGGLVVGGTFQGHARVGAGGPSEVTLAARGAGDALLVELALSDGAGE
jgi:hypothetical protein